MKRRYGDKVEFLAIYVREAHPTDGWRMSSNDAVGIRIQQPRLEEERMSVAKTCCDALKISMPMLVDEMDDRVGHAYSGMPDRMYLIDRAGRIAYKGGRGPFGFKPGELEQALVMLLLEEQKPAGETPPPARKATEKSPTAWVPLLSPEEAWRTLPQLEQGKPDRLPLWALATAQALPHTTAAVLELEHLHRAASPLNPILRGQLRLIAAHANGCAYTQAQAAADLRRAGVRDQEIATLLRAEEQLPPVLHFARKLTLAAYTVTDDEVAELVKAHGDKQLVAMVQLLAFANFQDRLVLSLGILEEPEGPLPPREYRFVKGAKAMARPAWPVELREGTPPVADADWQRFSFSDLKKRMEVQKERPARIRVPTWDEVKQSLPPEAQKRALRIKWSLACLGHQPELAQGWSACTRAFAIEASMDRVFEESLFWVVTRSLQCFY